jgi:hypothetical protein
LFKEHVAALGMTAYGFALRIGQLSASARSHRSRGRHPGDPADRRSATSRVGVPEDDRLEPVGYCFVP